MSKEVLSHRESVRKYKADRKANMSSGCQWCNTCGMARPNADFSLGYKTCNRHHSKPKPVPECSANALLGNPPASKNDGKSKAQKAKPRDNEPKPDHKIRHYLAYRTWWMKEHGLNPKTDKTPSQVRKSWDKYSQN